MKNMKTLAITVILAGLLSIDVFAGDVGNPVNTRPCDPAVETCTSASATPSGNQEADSETGILESTLSIVASLLSAVIS
jgi:hypothetical protein